MNSINTIRVSRKPNSQAYLAHALSDEIQNIYAGCDFDDTCNYVPKASAKGAIACITRKALPMRPMIWP